MKCTVDSIKYKSKPGTDGCNGCAGWDNSLCTRLDPCPNIIWVKAKAKVKPTIEVDGVTYKQVKENAQGSCDGCAAQTNVGLCDTLSPEGECADERAIWVKKKLKVKSVEAPKREVWLNIYPDDGDGQTIFAHTTREAAEQFVSEGLIACVRVEYSL